jgi:glutaredoxin
MANESDKSIGKKATEKLFAALNRADEIGGEVRDFLQERVAHDPRYVLARKRLAKLLGRDFQSRDEAAARAQAAEQRRASVAATATAAPKKSATPSGGFGDANLKAQIFGKKSCPWTGRAITLLEKYKLDYDYLDLEEPEHEAKLTPLANETRQHTVPYVYLRGQFIGGFNALAEIERLGQLEFAMMTAEERAALPEHQRSVVISPRPNTDEVAPAEADPSA